MRDSLVCPTALTRLPVIWFGVGALRVKLALAMLLILAAGSARAQERVRFASLAGDPPTQLDGYLFRPPPDGARHAAIVFLHGCGGLLNRSGLIEARERDWAGRFTALGDVVLMVDSFTPRGVRSMCAPATYQAPVFFARPRDAYGALLYLQAQDFVRPDRVGLMGWSEGGGAVLYSIEMPGLGRPPVLPNGDFRAAVAFYPARCFIHSHTEPWTTAIPLLVLQGALDVWTPAPPCAAMIREAAGRGVPAAIQIYPESYHDFDWPDMPQHEVPAFRTSRGVIPIEGTNPAARDDALARVPAFFAEYLAR